MRPELSLLMPARNEEFLARTITDALEHSHGDTEIIAVCDGYWPVPTIDDHPRVTVVHLSKSIGQRAATNLAARLSTAKYVAKCDAHCSFADGFDTVLMADCEYDMTMVPTQYTLHAFSWVCQDCGESTYQGPQPEKCDKCGKTDIQREMVWKPRKNKKTEFARFDSDLRFQYWSQYRKRPEAQGEIADCMCAVGCFWMMQRKRFWELGGCDEEHGSWGQMGVEVALKAVLSGGRHVVNRRTSYSHMFRTQKGFSFPYPLSGNATERARKYSRDLWMNNRWSKQVRPLSWMVSKFAPVPGWSDEAVKSLPPLS